MWAKHKPSGPGTHSTPAASSSEGLRNGGRRSRWSRGHRPSDQRGPQRAARCFGSVSTAARSSGQDGHHSQCDRRPLSPSAAWGLGGGHGPRSGSWLEGRLPAEPSSGTGPSLPLCLDARSRLPATVQEGGPHRLKPRPVPGHPGGGLPVPSAECPANPSPVAGGLSGAGCCPALLTSQDSGGWHPLAGPRS